MNPPSALYGAMNKERKPFTYTPGGLDLSEIKSERMAQRLMRNAMSEGVPEMPVQTIQSPPAQLNSSAIPNFNCLPVQVFPTFALPANPKSLLRSRSNPDPTKELLPSVNQPAQSLFISDEKSNMAPLRNINKPLSLISNNNNISTNDNKNVINNSTTCKSTNYGSDGYTEMILPEKCYDAEYFVLEPQGHVKLLENKTSKIEDNITSFNKPISDTNICVETERSPVALTSVLPQDRTTDDLEQKEVKIVKKQSDSGKEADQNGDTEAAIVVKLPTKKSSAKTETKVQVSKKVLPDGSIEEVKTTITKTTIDGRTETKTETETTILPKEGTDVEIEEVEEEIEENGTEEDKIENYSSISKSKDSSKTQERVSEEKAESEEIVSEVKENGNITSGEERIEISTSKNVVVTQLSEQESEEEREEEKEEELEEEVEEEEEAEKDDADVDVEQTIVLKKQEANVIEKTDEENSDEKLEKNVDQKEDEVEEVEEEEEVEDEKVEDEQENLSVEVDKEVKEADESEVEEDDEVEEEKDDATEQSQAKETIETEVKENIVEHNEEEFEKTKDVEKKEESLEKPDKEPVQEATEESGTEEKEILQTSTEASKEVFVQESSKESSALKDNKQQSKDEHIHKISFQPEPKVSFREPSIPLEKVEDVEIKPIGPAQEIIKKCHTEIITTTKDAPTGALSTQTEYNRIENIVTVNRTTKTLDHAYEQAEHTIPSVKTFFVPHNDRVLSTPQPITRPYQPVYTPEPQTERRHSLLLDRISVERQIPVQHTDIYQNNYLSNNQNYEQNQWLQEPQSEVLTVSNVKPSTITKNQQWYQQSKREENVTSDIVAPTPIMPSQLSQPHSQLHSKPQPQPILQPQQQPQYQNYVSPQYTPKPEYQPVYTDNYNQNSYNSNTTNIQQNVYSGYTPKPSWVSSTFETKPTPVAQPSQYSTLIQESKDSYHTSFQQNSSSYVPPPWEQDSSYVPEKQNYFQPPTASNVYTPNVNQSWNPKQPTSKFSKPAPTAYIPPAPNQSFVKPVTGTEPSLPGRKTYYSEYERRYISVPESTYIPSETKFQAQPDPSPQYYYDTNEPSETVEPQWRKELREFAEKTSQTTTLQTEKTSVRPPWENDPKYAAPQYTSTVTPTWTQTLRPRSWRERSFEPEYIGSKEWPKTNTLGRGRPQNSYMKSNVDTIQERPRGVSVDRYNPNSYQSPLLSEQPPVQSQTLNPNVHPKAYHNPTVPAYHARTSAEPREQAAAPYIQRTWVEARAPPVQSRSFKYLQWITGTED